jgi:superfamily II DNA or RNA helicase
MSQREPIIAETNGNLTTLSLAGDRPLPADVLAALEGALTYTYRGLNYAGGRRWSNDADDSIGNRMSFEERTLYRLAGPDNRQMVVCSGFLRRVETTLSGLGCGLLVSDTTPSEYGPGRPELAPDWDNVFQHFSLRTYQPEVLAAIAGNPCGIVEAPTGMGKGECLGMVRALYPRARLHIVVQGKDLVRDLVVRLTHLDPDVGQVGAGRKYFGRKTTVFSADSLKLSDGNCDILLADEVHSLATPSYLRHLGRYRYARCYGLTASAGRRLDGADIELEGLFGPLVYRLPYQAAQAAGLVVPVRVEWLNVVGPNPVEGMDDPVQRKRHGLWRHRLRNEILAEKSLSYGDDVQVLVMVETVDHLLRLRALLPGFRACYAASLTPNKVQRYRREGLMGPDERPPTDRERDALRLDFENGKVTKAIANTVWLKGVNFRSLQVLVRGDAGSSDVRDVQMPGRVCRVDDKGKAVGILVDCLDHFDAGFYRRSLGRRRNYQSFGWEQVTPVRIDDIDKDQPPGAAGQ